MNYLRGGRRLPVAPALVRRTATATLSGAGLFAGFVDATITAPVAQYRFVGGLRSEGDDDLAADLARLELADRVGDLGEGVRPFDAGCHVSSSGELRETIQPGVVLPKPTRRMR